MGFRRAYSKPAPRRSAKFIKRSSFSFHWWAIALPPRRVSTEGFRTCTSNFRVLQLCVAANIYFFFHYQSKLPLSISVFCTADPMRSVKPPSKVLPFDGQGDRPRTPCKGQGTRVDVVYKVRVWRLERVLV